MIVVDASVLADAVANEGPAGDLARKRLSGERAFAPHLIDLEVVSMLKRITRSGSVDPAVAEGATRRVALYPLTRLPHAPLLGRIWELRHNLSVYDASYVALAEALRVSLVTSDEAFARAPGVECEVELLRAR